MLRSDCLVCTWFQSLNLLTYVFFQRLVCFFFPFLAVSMLFSFVWFVAISFAWCIQLWFTLFYYRNIFDFLLSSTFITKSKSRHLKVSKLKKMYSRQNYMKTADNLTNWIARSKRDPASYKNPHVWWKGRASISTRSFLLRFFRVMSSSQCTICLYVFWQ